MPHKDEALYLQEILDAIQQIHEYTKSGREEFLASSLVQDAVALNLIVIGEAARNLSEETRARAPEIPWRQVVGLRNRLSHTYLTTDPQIVWRVVEGELESLRRAVERLRSEPPASD